MSTEATDADGLMSRPETPDDRVARAALPAYKFSDRTDLRMINLSENATYQVEDPATGKGGVLRVHRQEYHSPRQIESELMWLNALRDGRIVETPHVIPTRDGARLVTVPDDGIDRYVVLFERIPGAEPDEGQIGRADFRTLGALTARLHEHAKQWRLPPGFKRFSWDWEHTLGASPRWGRWQDGINIGEAERPVLTRAADLVQARLSEYGAGPGEFGLVHADLRLANLLVEGDTVRVIDFDDCGFSWFMYDLGTAVSFIEHDPRLGDWIDAWCAGYRESAELSPRDEAMLPTFVMLRRLMLVAWMGSHSHARRSRTRVRSMPRARSSWPRST